MVRDAAGCGSAPGDREAALLAPRSHPSDTRVTLGRLRVPSVAFAEVGDETKKRFSVGNNAYTAAGPEMKTGTEALRRHTVYSFI